MDVDLSLQDSIFDDAIYFTCRTVLNSTTRKILPFIITGLCALMVSSCSKTDGDYDQSQVGSIKKDQLGRDVHVPGEVNRLITLMPNLTEIVFAVGAGDKVVASSLADSYPLAVTSLPRFNSLPLDHEQILVNKPDLLLAVDGLNNIEDAKKLKELGIPTYYLKFESLDDIATAMTEIGALLGTVEQAKSARNIFEDGIRRSPMTGKSVVVLNGLEVLYSFGADSYVSELVMAAGGRLISDVLEGNAVVLSDEFMVAEDPDLILLASSAEMTVDQLLIERPSWRGISAAKNRQLYNLDPDILLRPSPRISQAVDSLKTWLGGGVQVE